MVDKCIWDLVRKSYSLWVQWIHRVYLKGQNSLIHQTSEKASWI